MELEELLKQGYRNTHSPIVIGLFVVELEKDNHRVLYDMKLNKIVIEYDVERREPHPG